MNLNLSDPATILTIIGVLLICSFMAIKFLIDHSFKQQEKLKNLEAKSLLDMYTRLEDDIDGLGSKLRGFKSAMESFQSTIAEITLQHKTLDLRLQAVEVNTKALEQSLEKKVSDILTIELYNLSKDEKLRKS